MTELVLQLDEQEILLMYTMIDRLLTEIRKDVKRAKAAQMDEALDRLLSAAALGRKIEEGINREGRE